MAKTSKQTSKRVASKASKVLRDGRYSKISKSVAGSALSQTKKKQQKKQAVTDLNNQPVYPILGTNKLFITEPDQLQGDGIHHTALTSLSVGCHVRYLYFSMAIFRQGSRCFIQHRLFFVSLRPTAISRKGRDFYENQNTL